MLQATEGEPLSVRNAISSCSLFGIGESSVRVTLVRLASAGLIEAAGRGTYRLGSSATGLAAEVANWRTTERQVCAWNGDWILVPVGALGRSDRVALRARDRALALLGLRELERGLFVRPDNLLGSVTAVRERLYRLGLEQEAAVFVARDLDTRREDKARTLWNDEHLSRSYLDMRTRLEEWLAHAGELEPDVAARESFLLGGEAIRQLVFDPLLPSPLVDTEARRAFTETVHRFDHAGRAIWQQLRLLTASSKPTAHLTTQ